MTAQRIVIDGQRQEVLSSTGLGRGVCIETDAAEYLVYASSEDAGEDAADRWREMAEHDPRELVCLLGEARLVRWAIGQPDDYGISSFEEFLGAVAGHPEEELAGYDGHEVDVDRVGTLAREYPEIFNSDWPVAYRTN